MEFFQKKMLTYTVIKLLNLKSKRSCSKSIKYNNRILQGSGTCAPEPHVAF